MDLNEVYTPLPENHKVMTTKDWLKTQALLLIPFVNIVLLFVWAFGKEGNLNRRNWARAHLIFVAIIFVIEIVILFLFLGTILTVFSGI